MGTKRCSASLGETVVLPDEVPPSNEAVPVMVEVPNNKEWQIMFRLIKKEHFPVICLVPSGVRVRSTFRGVGGWEEFLKSSRGLFVDISSGHVSASDYYCQPQGYLDIKPGASFQLSFSSEPLPRLLYSGNKHKLTEVSFGRPIPMDDYVLYVIVDRGCKVELTLVGGAKRRRTSPAALLQHMWSDVEFADCEVACAGRAFPAHRAVLCKASPVFAATFRGGMKEAAEARLEITGATAEAVHAMLSYIYAGAPGAGVAADVDVLHLAHRYQVDDLVRECCEQMLASLTTTNMGSIVKGLRVLRNDPTVAPTWEALVEKILSDKSLVRAALEVC